MIAFIWLIVNFFFLNTSTGKDIIQRDIQYANMSDQSTFVYAANISFDSITESSTIAVDFKSVYYEYETLAGHNTREGMNSEDGAFYLNLIVLGRKIFFPIVFIWGCIGNVLVLIVLYERPLPPQNLSLMILAGNNTTL